MYRIRRNFRQIPSMSRRALSERPYNMYEGRSFFDTLTGEAAKLLRYIFQGAAVSEAVSATVSQMVSATVS